MATPSTLDPYRTLGVEADADAAAIKKAYRKLVLTCHPDKVTDESLREEKQEEFHRIQQAYETIGEPDKREQYDNEIKLKKLREERDRISPRNSPTQARHVNVNIYTARPPPEFRTSSSSKRSPSKGSSSFKQYSPDFSRSWEHGIPNRSRASEDERRSRRTVSEEKLRRDPHEPRRDVDRERRKQREEEEEYERSSKKAARRAEEKERERERERELRERARRAEKDRKEREERRERKEREERDERERIAQAKQDRKARDRAAEKEREREQRRKQEADEKARAKAKPYLDTYSEEEEEIRRSSAKKTSKKDSPVRDKSSSKRSSPLDEKAPEPPTTENLVESKLAFAASYIKNQQQPKSSKSSSKHAADTTFSAEYPDPSNWVPKRRVSGDARHSSKTDAVYVDTGVPSRDRPDAANVSPITQSLPRLQKSYTTGHAPESMPTRIPFSRAQTMEPEFFSRSSRESQRHRSSRGRTYSVDEDDAYLPHRFPLTTTKSEKKYGVSRDNGTPRTYETHSKDPYSPSPSATFPKVKMSEHYGPNNLSTSQRYDHGDYATSSYSPPSYSDYNTTTTAYGQPFVTTNV